MLVLLIIRARDTNTVPEKWYPVSDFMFPKSKPQKNISVSTEPELYLKSQSVKSKKHCVLVTKIII
jgi:hypothetical protein